MHITRKAFRRMLPVSSIFFYSLAMLFILSACNMGGSASSSSTPVIKKATPTPTIALTTYTAKTFLIGYPAKWNATNQSNISKVPGVEQAEFGQDIAAVVVQSVPNPHNVGPEKYIATITNTVKGLTLKNTKPDSIPTTVKVANETWAQQGYTGDGDSNGTTVPSKATCLVTDHLVNHHMYSICFAGETTNLTRDEFHAMLNSFQFK